MQLGMVGLGKMGDYMTQRLIKGGHEVVAYDRDPQAVAKNGQRTARPAPTAWPTWSRS